MEKEVTLEELNEHINDLYKLKFNRKYPNSHVFDEDKSVRWNREMVYKKNEEFAKATRGEYEKELATTNELIDKYITQRAKDYLKVVDRAFIDRIKKEFVSSYCISIEDIEQIDGMFDVFFGKKN